ncbi:hypothetical protein [Clostridium sp. Marseille-P2415]|uniref:hypothetical protein n=1 Tax=Clostridium sp. Marseille-P2415 TaxID=1805471 RepID=UPI0009888A96|nr:hypothetical protein [Clostridium sp. Marseille-P2415]
MLEKIRYILIKLGNACVFFLPDSPFQSFINQIDKIPFLGYLNYFVPVAQIIAITQLWVTAIAVFYLVQLALRWVKMIE